MPLPEGYLPRVGDVLIVHVVVKYDVDQGEDAVHANVVGVSYRDVVVPLNQIVGLYCRKWNEGDKVLVGEDHEYNGEVLATHGDQVWVKIDTGKINTYDANHLRPHPGSTPDLIVAAPPPGLNPII